MYASCNLPTSVCVTAVRHTGTPTYQHTDSCWHRRSECHHLVSSRLIQSPYTVALYICRIQLPYTVALSTMAMYPAVATNQAIEAHWNRLSHCVNPPNPLNSIWKSTRKLLIFGLFCFPFSCYLFSCLFCYSFSYLLAASYRKPTDARIKPLGSFNQSKNSADIWCTRFSGYFLAQKCGSSLRTR